MGRPQVWDRRASALLAWCFSLPCFLLCLCPPWWWLFDPSFSLMICSQRRALAFGKNPGNTLSVTMVCWDISESSCSEGDAGIPAKLLWDRNSCKRHHSNTLLVSVCCTLLGAERELCPVCSFSYLCMKCEGEGKRERQEKSVFLCQTKGEFPSGPRRVQEGLVLNSLSRNCRLCSLLQ